MRQRPDKDRAESRVVSRYHKLYIPLVDLVQSLEDLIPQGMQLGENVEFTDHNDHISIAFGPRPVRIIVKGKEQVFVLQILDPKEYEKRRVQKG
jgi:hypothetical protein